MSGPVIVIPAAVHSLVMHHLLPHTAYDEEAAFLFLRDEASANAQTLTFIDWLPVERSGFAYQSAGYLELADDMRPLLLRRAHELSACLVEMHSHPYDYPAAFSSTDLNGLADFVPHVRWRLKGRPYVAIVVAPSGFDALAWCGPSNQPITVESILAGDDILRPTNLTMARLALQDRDG